MKRGWQCTGMAFAILFAAWAQQSWTLSLTDALGPGPGFFPFVLSLAGVALAVALTVRAGSIEHEPAPPGQTLFPRGRALRTVLVVLAGLCAMAVLLEPLGFRLSVAAFCLLLLPTLGARSPLVVAAFAAVASFGVYSLFADVLKVPLPIGLLGI